MRIVSVNDEHIEFEDGRKITFNHEQDWCEYNYAQFDALDDIALDTDFDLDNLAFEPVDHAGFRFGNSPNKMFFVPCYSEQSGYYTDEIDIYFDGVCRLTLECEEVYD